ncbi:hypothetical protein GUITHDRAFT_88116, partial [Guillardia theta CCMP2712]
MEIITKNILSNFNLDVYGNDIVDSERTVVEENEDPDAIALRKLIQDTVKRRQEEAFLSLSYAATAGDIEEVKRVLRKGVGINSCNYDGKTVLHMAASEGNFRVVELLLEEGALKNQKDSRWGRTPLQDAVENGHVHVAEQIHYKGGLLPQSAGPEQICKAASSGDTDKMERFLKIGLHVDETDSNGRTALHVAACEGQVEATKFLLQHRASVSIKDKYKNTALHDAVRHGHDQLAALLRAQNQTLSLPSPEAGVFLCKFAFRNEEQQIQRFLANGVEVNEPNYDGRTALHIAACEGHLGLVKFLLGR